jgi:hypothetical protein
MNTKDITSEINVKKLTNLSFLASATTAQTSDTVDTQGSNAFSLFVWCSRAITSGEVTVKLQHSKTTTSGDFVDVPAEMMLPSKIGNSVVIEDTFTTTYQQPISAFGTDRYIRAIVTPALTATAAIVTISAALCPEIKPAVGFKPTLYADTKA